MSEFEFFTKKDGTCFVDNEIHCKKSSTLYTVIDNTGTRFSWTAEILLTFTDGSTTVVTQTPTGGWTAQLNQWVTIIGDALKEKCPQSAAEARCNIVPGGCGGLLPPPTELIGRIPSMRWRYLQLLACPNCPAIERAQVISVDGTALTSPKDLTLSFIKGREVRYHLCINCEDPNDSVLYYQDGYQPEGATTLEVAEADMPICLFDCAEEIPAIPETACNFELVEICDSDRPDDQTFVQFADCGDGQIVNAFYFVDVDGGLVEYIPNEGAIGPCGNEVSSIVQCDECGNQIECVAYDDGVTLYYSWSEKGGRGEQTLPIGELGKCEEECGEFTGDCRCYGGAVGSESLNYVNADNNTDISFSANTSTIKWEIQLGQQAEADATGPFIADCVNGGNPATITITDQDGNIYVFTADSVQGDGTATGAWAFGGTGPGGFSGKVVSAEIICGASTESGKACSRITCDGEVEWVDTITGEILTPEQVETLVECTIPVSIEPECAETAINSIACAAEAVTGVDIDDQILTVAIIDCENVIIRSNQYNVTQGNAELTEPVLTTDCDPQPDVETVYQCIIDAEGNVWTVLTVIDPDGFVTSGPIYVNQETLEVGTPSGEQSEWTPCPPEGQPVGCKKVCGTFDKGATSGGETVFAYDYDGIDIPFAVQGSDLTFTVNGNSTIINYGSVAQLNTDLENWLTTTCGGTWSVTFTQAIGIPGFPLNNLAFTGSGVSKDIPSIQIDSSIPASSSTLVPNQTSETINAQPVKSPCSAYRYDFVRDDGTIETFYKLDDREDYLIGYTEYCCDDCIDVACPVSTGRGSFLWNITFNDGTVWTAGAEFPSGSGVGQIATLLNVEGHTTTIMSDPRNLVCVGSAADIGEVALVNAPNGGVASIEVGPNLGNTGIFTFTQLGKCSVETTQETVDYGFCDANPAATDNLLLTPGGSDNGGICDDEWLKFLIAKSGTKEQIKTKAVKSIKKRG